MIAPRFSIEIGGTGVGLNTAEVQARVRARLRAKLIVLTNELLAEVKAGEPRRTGRLQSITRSFVDERDTWIRGRVRVLRNAGARSGAAAGALEYGAPGRRGAFAVKTHRRRLTRVYGRSVPSTSVMVHSYTRTARIRARRYLHGPAATWLPRARLALERALTEAIRDSMMR